MTRRPPTRKAIADQEVQRDAHRATLLRQVHAAGPRAVPCLTSALLPASHWTSDEPEHQAGAAEACRGCPLLAECGTYGLTWPREAGVYGAMTEPERQRAARANRDSA